MSTRWSPRGMVTTRARAAAMVLLGALAASGCAAGVAQDEYDQVVGGLEGQVASLGADLQAAQEQTAALGSQVTTLEGERDEAQAAAAAAAAAQTELEAQLEQARAEAADLQEQLAQATGQAGDLTAQLEEAQAEVAALLLAYDREIQAARSAFEDDATPRACQVGREQARAGRSPAFTVGLLDLEVPAGLDDYPVADLLDLEAVAAEYRRCLEEEQATVEEEERVAALTAPKSSGFYVIGEEMKAGVWKSTGTGEDCYWERLRDLSGEIDDVIANYFGAAGVTVRIRSTDAAFSSSYCGTWEYQGP